MQDRPRFFDDIAGMAGGALSALQGMREEMESQMRARVDDAIRKLDLVRRDELDAIAEMAANARAGQEAAEARLSALEARMAAMGGTPAPQGSKPGASEGDPASVPPAGGEPSPAPHDEKPGASEGDRASLPPGTAPGR
jgi:BMFP domain-containing protein YqiC